MKTTWPGPAGPAWFERQNIAKPCAKRLSYLFLSEKKTNCDLGKNIFQFVRQIFEAIFDFWPSWSVQIKLLILDGTSQTWSFQCSQVFLRLTCSPLNVEVPQRQSTSASAGRSFEPQEAQHHPDCHFKMLPRREHSYTATCMKDLESGLMIELYINLFLVTLRFWPPMTTWISAFCLRSLPQFDYFQRR